MQAYFIASFCTLVVPYVRWPIPSDDLSKQRLWALWERAHPDQTSLSNPATPTKPNQSDKGQSDDKEEEMDGEVTEDQLKQQQQEGWSPEQAEADQARKSPVVNGYQDEEHNSSLASSKNTFKNEPFVMAATQFRQGMFTGLLELLTEALKTGRTLNYCIENRITIGVDNYAGQKFMLIC